VLPIIYLRTNAKRRIKAMGFFNRGKKRIPVNATFQLTQGGRDKLQEFSGDATSQILMALETRGTLDIDEISQNSGLSKSKVERLIPILAQKQYVQYIGATTAVGE